MKIVEAKQQANSVEAAASSTARWTQMEPDRPTCSPALCLRSQAAEQAQADLQMQDWAIADAARAATKAKGTAKRVKFWNYVEFVG